MRLRLLTTSIRTRLLVAYVGIILIGFSGLTVLAGGQITAAVRADYSQRLQYEIRLIAQGTSQSIDAYIRGELTEAELTTIFKAYEMQSGGTLALYSIGESPHSYGEYERPPVGSFFDMPEMETALRGETVLVERKNEAGEDTLYTASAIVLNRQVKGLIQLSVPSQNIQGLVLQRWAILGLSFVLVTSAALLAALWLSRSIIQPLFALRESAVRLSQGDFSHRVTVTWKDEIGEVAQAFNEMARQVQSMLEEQRAFASNTSHELRTPLTAIRLRTEALRNDPTLDEATARRYIEEIDDEVASLGNLVQDLTLLSRFDAGRAELGHAQIDFARLATNLCQQLSPQAAEKRLELTLLPPDQPVLVNASLNHLTVVFRNLLDNAIKYTPDGGQISWRIQSGESGVCHTIQDTGSGIAPQHLPHIFERFYRADKARSRDIPGTGLGLALVKSIVEAYGGHITVESDGVGKGTTARVYWPYVATAPKNGG
jgi:signal transduction histidine kinase